MLDAVQILNEMNRRILAALPECKTVYIDLCPQEFERPSALLQATESTTEVVGPKTYERTDEFIIVLTDEVGERYETQTLRLLEMREKVFAIFLPGFLRVGDRAPKISAKIAEREFDKAVIEVTATYRETLPEPEPQPLMRELHLDLKGDGN